MKPFAINRLLSGGIITNYHCTSRCRHCLYNCSPAREKGYMDDVSAHNAFETVSRMGCRSVHIGGGEPFLNPGGLQTVLEVAGQWNVAIDYVETNSSWFRQASSAEALLDRLKKKGLSTLLISISPFHNEYIPFAKVEGVMAAARKVGVDIFPWIADFAPEIRTFDPDTVHSLKTYGQTFGRSYLADIPQRYWIHMGGRALVTFRSLLTLSPAERILDTHPGSCEGALADTSHFHIDLFGNYIPGLCAGIAIAAPDLAAVLTESRYPLITLLAQSGIRGLFAFAREELGFSPMQAGYINACDLCTEIRGYIRQTAPRYRPELNPGGFYAHLAD